MKKLSLLIASLMLIGCNQQEYPRRIGKECNFADHLKVTLSKVEEKNSIQIKESKDSEEFSTLEKNGFHYICCSFDFKCDNATEAKYTFADKDNFKLKDHPGIAIGGGKTFTTLEAIKDYSWLNSEIKTSETLAIAVAFEISTKFSPTSMDMYVEIDLPNETGIDILLKD